jgi:hypothetical protein
MSNEQSDYFSYLLRLWRENDKERTTWRASLEHSRTARRRVFPSLDDLFQYLEQQIGVGLVADGGNDEDTTMHKGPTSPPPT